MRLAYPVRVIVTTTSSRAMRSSIETSPSNGMIRVRRSSPHRSTISASSSEMIFRCRSGLARMSFELGDVDLDLGQLVDDLLPLQRGQAAQLHVEDRGGLDLVDVEQLHQAGARLLDRRRAPDQGDHLVEHVERLDQAAQDVRPLLGLAQPVRGPPDDDLDLVRHVVPDELGQVERARHAVDQRQHVGAEGLLQLGVLVEVVQHDLGHGVALEHQDQPHAGTAAGLVADVGDAGELALLDQVGAALGEVVRVHLVRQLGDDQAGAAALVLLDLDHGAHPDRAAAGAVRLLDRRRCRR